MLVVCSIFVMNAGFIFGWAMLNMMDSSGQVIKTAKAIWFSSHFLFALCIFHFFVACVLAFHFSSRFFVTLALPIIWTVWENIFSTFIYRILSMYVNHKRNAVICLYTLGGNTICYISCWLVIGIRINPLWGLTVAFSIFSSFAASTYVVYLYLEVTGTYPLPDFLFYNFFSTFEPSGYSRQNYQDDRNRVLISLSKFLRFSQSFGVKFVCLRLCIAVGSFFVFVILAGPSIGGQTGADELLKTSSLYFITAFITWATFRKRTSNDAPLRNERPQNVELQDTDNHTGDHRGELGTPAFITGATLRNRASNDAPLRNERPQNVELQDTDHHTGDHRGALGTPHYYRDDRQVSYQQWYITNDTWV